MATPRGRVGGEGGILGLLGAALKALPFKSARVLQEVPDTYYGCEGPPRRPRHLLLADRGRRGHSGPLGGPRSSLCPSSRRASSKKDLTPILHLFLAETLRPELVLPGRQECPDTYSCGHLFLAGRIHSQVHLA
jgi:hypothetical protein